MGWFFAAAGGLSKLFYEPFSALGYGHPLHPVFVHLTIGTVTAAFIFSYVAWLFKKPALYATAAHTSVLAFVSFLFTAAIGFLDWQRPEYLHAWGVNIEMKFILSFAMFLLLLGLLLSNRRAGRDSPLSRALYLLAFLSAVGLGFFGGNIVYGNGVG